MAPKMKAINLVFGQTRWVLNMNDLYLNEKLKVKNQQTCLYQEVHFHNFFGSHKLFLIVECWFCSCCFSMTSILGAKYLVLSPLLPSKPEKNVSDCSVYIFFGESVFTFQFLNAKIHNYVKKNHIFVNSIIQKLKSKHTFLKKYKN